MDCHDAIGFLEPKIRWPIDAPVKRASCAGAQELQMIRSSLAVASKPLQSLMATLPDQRSLKLVLCAKTSEVGTGKTHGATDLGLLKDATVEVRPLGPSGVCGKSI